MRHPWPSLLRLVPAARLTLVLCSAAFFFQDSRFTAAAQSADAGSCTPPPAGSISQSQVAQFESVESGLKDREAQANHDYANDKLRCKADPKPSACIMTAQKKFQNAETAIQVDRDTNDANRQKAEIDAGAARDECNVTGQSAAEKQENLRHFRALIDLKKKNVDVQVDYNIAKLDCQLYSSPASADSGGAQSSDKRTTGENYDNKSRPAGCTSEAEKTYKAAQINLEAATNDENFLHSQNLAKIQKQ